MAVNKSTNSADTALATKHNSSGVIHFFNPSVLQHKLNEMMRSIQNNAQTANANLFKSGSIPLVTGISLLMYCAIKFMLGTGNKLGLMAATVAGTVLLAAGGYAVSESLHNMPKLK